jgi:hypothetical protein
MAERREVVGVLDDAASFEAAARELLTAGFAPDDLSLLAGHETVAAKLGHRYERVEELEDDPEAPRIAYREIPRSTEDLALPSSLAYLPAVLAGGLVVASPGAAAAVIGVGALAGGLIGTVFGHWLDKRHAGWLQDRLDHGGILLWVRTPDEALEQRAADILRRHSAHDVHVHTLPDASA